MVKLKRCSVFKYFSKCAADLAEKVTVDCLLILCCSLENRNVFSDELSCLHNNQDIPYTYIQPMMCIFACEEITFFHAK